MAFQTPYDSIKYITNELASPTFLSYNKFIDYIQTLFVYNYYGFIEELNKFKTILIDLDEHTWELYVEEKKELPSRKEMFEYNGKIEKEKEDKRKKKLDFKREFIKKKVKNIDSYKIRGE